MYIGLWLQGTKRIFQIKGATKISGKNKSENKEEYYAKKIRNCYSSPNTGIRTRWNTQEATVR